MIKKMAPNEWLSGGIVSLNMTHRRELTIDQNTNPCIKGDNIAAKAIPFLLLTIV